MDTLAFLDSDGDSFGLYKVPGIHEIRVTSQSRYIALNKNTAAQLWPILRHFAATGELVEVPPVADDAPLGVAELGNRVAMLIESAQKLEFRILALEQDHLPGRMHRANEPHAFGAVPVCVCGCSLDDHARDPQARSVVLGCEKCGTCEKFHSAELRYMEAT